MPASAGTRAAILDVALDLFRGQGYDATSLRQIAERLSITKAALYYHFPAKENLVIELTRPFLDGLSDIIARARARAREGTDVTTEELLGQYLDLFIAQHAIISLLARDPGAVNHPDVGLRAATLVKAFEQELVGPEATDADHVRVACAINAINAVAGITSARIPNARPYVLAAALAALRSAPADAPAGEADGGGEPRALRGL